MLPSIKIDGGSCTEEALHCSVPTRPVTQLTVPYGTLRYITVPNGLHITVHHGSLQYQTDGTLRNITVHYGTLRYITVPYGTYFIYIYIYIYKEKLACSRT